MKITVHTNIDRYKKYSVFPEYLSQVPRIGDTILVTEIFKKYFIDQKLPLRLEVVDVIWSEHGVTCELYYKKIDIDIAKQNGINLF